MKKLLLISLIGSPLCLFSQNLDKIGEEDAVTVSGGINLNTVAYAQSGLQNPMRDPFTWYASGNLTVNVLDVALPFTYSYSNQGGNFTQPFNRAALHPTYKWAKGHIGLVSMNFSPYTLSGHIFLGGGIELTPGKWNIQAMGGRLRKALEYDPSENNLNDISFNRWGYGLKAAYENKGYGGEVTIFKAFDDQGSLLAIPNNSEISPQDNLVISVKGKAKFTKSLSMEAEYAISGLTQNTFNTDDLSSENQNFLYGAINGNATSDFFHAVNSSLNYSHKSFSIGAKFEHIDPNYKTLGGYYFNNDLQNYTLTPTFTLLKKKMNISLNTGFQRNNLSSTEQSTTNRWIGSANVSFVPNSKLVLNGSYSNFSSFTRNRPVSDPFYFQPSDTLNFFQLTQAGSFMASTNWGSDDFKSVVQGLYNYQESINLTGNIQSAGAFGLSVQSDLTGIPARTHLINLNYTAQFVQANTNLSLSTNVNRTNVLDQTTTFLGPTITLGKSLLNKKANLSLGTTYNKQYANEVLSSNILNHRVSFTWNPKFENDKIGNVGISMNANLLQRFATQTGSSNVHELNVFLNLSYNF